MEKKPASDYANVFMAKKVDNKFWEIAENYMKTIDDIFLIFVGSIASLHKIFEDINNMHPTIKFTMSLTTRESEWNQPPYCEMV